MNFSNLKIRIATIDDITKCIELLECHEKDMQQYRSYVNKITTSQVIEYLINDSYSMLLLQEDDVIVGFALCKVEMYILYVKSLYIDAEHRSKHYGEYLLNFLKEKLNVDGMKEIGLAVHKKNTRAISFYKKNKFKTDFESQEIAVMSQKL